MMLSSSVFTVLTAAAAVSPVVAETIVQQPEAYQQRLVDWVRSGENGFFHPSVQWKRLGGNGPYAMHATEDLPKGTKLLVVPRSHVIDSFKTHDHCVTVARMIEEYQKGDDSFFAPYLSYLFDDTAGGTTTGLLPCSWSNEGKELLLYILGNDSEDDDEREGLEPRYFERESVFQSCGINFRGLTEHDELKGKDLRQQAEDAYLFWVSRSWTDKMVPILDMYNHRNGASLNVESTSAHIDEDITAYALRDIKAGEQLQNTYSECMDNDCQFGGIKYEYHTPLIYSDYGFLEFYPRRWTLNQDGQDVMAEVDEDFDGEKSFKWIFETPTKSTIEWTTEQLGRLKEIESDVRKLVAKHRNFVGEKHNNIPHEADSLLEIFEGYVEVLELALKHKDDPVGVTKKQFDKELDERRNQIRRSEL